MSLPKGGEVNVQYRDEQYPIHSQPFLASAENATSPYGSKLRPQLADLWKTPVLMVVLFLIALFAVAAHLVLFVILNDRQTTGPDTISQNYVAALSHFFGLMFRTSLCGSLVIAFTQCLWRLMRQKTIKVSNIDTLFKITQNPLLLALPAVIRTTPVLFLLASFTWLLPLAIVFPPGALIVVNKDSIGTSSVTVPTYDGSAIGNGTAEGARSVGLAVYRGSGSAYIYFEPIPTLRRLSRSTIEAGEIFSSPSPCGTECSYSFQFEGPYLRCNQSRIKIQLPNARGCSYTVISMDTSGYTNPDALIYANRSLALTSSASSSVDTTSVYNQEIEMSICTPSRALYTAKFLHQGGVRTISHETQYQGPLQDLITADPIGYLNPQPGCPQNRTACAPDAVLKLLTAYNHRALIDALVKEISGTYSMTGSLEFVDYSQSSSMPIQCGPSSGNIIGDSRFNTQRDNFAGRADPVFAMSEDLLDEALFNLTMNAALSFGYWKTSVQASTTSISTVYSFASPFQILFPYVGCLVMSLPFLTLGLRSLRLNGASAMDGGFLQVLVTTAGSKRLHEVAVKSCVGGDENISTDLKNLPVRFGELVDIGSDQGGRRAGFGMDTEISPLRRGVTYG